MQRRGGQGCIRTAVHRRRRGGTPPGPPSPRLLPFPCLRLTANILLRSLRRQEDLSLNILGPPSAGTMGRCKEEGYPSPLPPFQTHPSPPLLIHPCRRGLASFCPLPGFLPMCLQAHALLKNTLKDTLCHCVSLTTTRRAKFLFQVFGQKGNVTLLQPTPWHLNAWADSTLLCLLTSFMLLPAALALMGRGFWI